MRAVRAGVAQARRVRGAVLLLLAGASAMAPAIAKPDAWHVARVPFKLADMTEPGGTAVFAPIDGVDANSIRLRGEDGESATFPLGASTIFCHGDRLAPDWRYLSERVALKGMVTVMTNAGVDHVLVVWDQEPRLVKGPSVFPVILFPPLCR